MYVGLRITGEWQHSNNVEDRFSGGGVTVFGCLVRIGARTLLATCRAIIEAHSVFLGALVVYVTWRLREHVGYIQSSSEAAWCM